jgi:hypothetical protein
MMPLLPECARKVHIFLIMTLPLIKKLIFSASLILIPSLKASALEAPLAVLTLTGPPETVFASPKNACDGYDVPDTSPRFYRDAEGEIVLFGMHFRNRAMRGKDFSSLKLDCHVVLDSGFNADPAAYDDRSWISSTWTFDGRTVHALIHHEYRADDHQGQCSVPKADALACWYNSVTAVASFDRGRNFKKPDKPRLVASSPFKQDVEQSRHRGFFNPSNIITDAGYFYFFATTTGWDGQENGVCLFRSADIADPSAWRAYDGEHFSIRYPDPYQERIPPLKPCKTLDPFPVGVGSVTRHKASGQWIAVFQVEDSPGFAKPGFYYAASRNLLTWTAPTLLVEGKTLYGNPCTSGGRLLAYPALVDHEARSRNFDETGDHAYFYSVTLKTKGCDVLPERILTRRKIVIKVLK